MQRWPRGACVLKLGKGASWGVGADLGCVLIGIRAGGASSGIGKVLGGVHIPCM